MGKVIAAIRNKSNAQSRGDSYMNLRGGEGSREEVGTTPQPQTQGKARNKQKLKELYKQLEHEKKAYRPSAEEHKHRIEAMTQYLNSGLNPYEGQRQSQQR